MEFDLNIHTLSAQIAVLTRQRCLLQALDQLATDWRADGGTATLTLVGSSVHLVVPLPSLLSVTDAVADAVSDAVADVVAKPAALDPMPEVAPAPRDWSALELDRLRRMDAAGHPAGVIATTLGRAVADVKIQLRAQSRVPPETAAPESPKATVESPIAPVASVSAGAPPISEPRTAPTVKGGTMPATWTTAEDDTFLRLKVSGLGFAEISARMGRPVDGLKFRLRHKLKARYDAMRQGEPALVPVLPPAITAPPAAIKATLTPAAPSAAPPVPPAPPAAVEPQLPAPRAVVAAPPLPSPPAPRPRPTAVPVAIDADLPTHIAALALPAGWTHDLDIEMLELASGGMKEGDIAAFLDLDIADLRARFDGLTGYDRSSKVRRFPRADVLAHLQARRSRDQVAA